MLTLFKVYMGVLTDRLRKEVEGKGIIRGKLVLEKEWEGMDNIYVINYLVNRQLGKRGRNLVALFVDLKAAFGSIDRGNDYWK